MANLNKSIENIFPGHHTIAVQGVSNGNAISWNLDRKEFERFADNNGSRKWSLDFYNGQMHQTLRGLMDWDEYYQSKETVLDDIAEFISTRKLKPAPLTIQN